MKRTWHDQRMTDQEARYDAIAEGYAEWWSPVHRPGTLGLLDEIAPDVESGARRLLDVGCGTGAMAVAAAVRWDAVEVDGVDASAGMLAIAEREAGSLPPHVRRRLRFAHAPADRLPFADGTFDIAASAFVLQLVPSRFRALREMRRVLRVGGRLAYVTWLQGGERFAPDTVYDEVRVEVGLESRWPDDDEDREAWANDTDDVASPGAAIAQLRRAGFSDARARADTLRHPFTPEGYIGFVTRFDDESEFAEMEPARREALEHLLLGRLRRFRPEELVMRMPIVYASGIRRS
jgi:ubiquinone/menaquinone biosynthesis C-methylase UbiE